MRQNHVDEMSRLLEAIIRTKSDTLRVDYMKAYIRMSNDLREYDRLHKKSADKKGCDRGEKIV